MRKYVLIPDSFKGTMSSLDVCRIVTDAILSQEPDAAVCAIPVADGGEGTVDAFLSAVGGQRIPVNCTGPYGEPITACYGLLPDGTAVVEMAAAAGLPMVGEKRDPERTTTCGVGQLIVHAARQGARQIVLALGGSATNDGGCGAAAAAGVGIGAFESLSQAVGAISQASVIQPQEETYASYEALRRRYDALYPALAPVFHL